MRSIKRKKSPISWSKILSLFIFFIILAVTLFLYRTYGEVLAARGNASQEILRTEESRLLLFSFFLLHITFFSLASLQKHLCKRDRTKQLKSTSPIISSELHHPKLLIQSPVHKQEV
ncbi:hypothetical protein BJL90_01205 [Clostridium formicaceticum]|uniref:Uncharacterized protein n=1 Tax=Clostridium formicaceticum TaxID=1497 RepID=A0ABN4T3I6_9CLOT|nr:hypothetical protein BJL90_01205 [Clostridium formicaceticum]